MIPSGRSSIERGDDADAGREVAHDLTEHVRGDRGVEGSGMAESLAGAARGLREAPLSLQSRP